MSDTGSTVMERLFDAVEAVYIGIKDFFLCRYYFKLPDYYPGCEPSKKNKKTNIGSDPYDVTQSSSGFTIKQTVTSRPLVLQNGKDKLTRGIPVKGKHSVTIGNGENYKTRDRQQNLQICDSSVSLRQFSLSRSPLVLQNGKGKLTRGIPVKGKHSVTIGNGENYKTRDRQQNLQICDSSVSLRQFSLSHSPLVLQNGKGKLTRGIPVKGKHSVTIGNGENYKTRDRQQNLQICDSPVSLRQLSLSRSPSDSENNYYSDERDVNNDIQKFCPEDVRTYTVRDKYTGRIMTGVSEQERRVILEFCHLLEKSKLFFNGLRELSPYGQKHWQGHFSRTFDVYAKLWKFQQQNRSTLDIKYGLKRWQIGEIASKIGQLYYHFYLRTSETAYLVEAYSFYSAIRGRRYYTLAIKESKCELMVKKLRFYARSIAVAILLQQPNIIDELLLELESQVIAYGKTYDPNDQVEWSRVLEEVRAFLCAEPGVTIRDPDNKDKIVTVKGRINPLCIPQIEISQQMCLTLKDAVIIGSGTQLVKFSELTIDMFRMVQVLEFEVTVPIRDPSNNSPKQDGKNVPPTPPPPPPPPLSIFDGTHDHDGPCNPHKFLLFKPSPSQALIYLAASCNELPINGALLVYVSAHGHSQPIKHPENYAYDLGGLITTSNSDVYNEDREVSSKYRDPQIFYPGDLQPFTRKPLFVIIDSDNSFAFQHIPRTFGQPLVILMSPVTLPPTLTDRSEQGNLFTLFLHNPIAGLCNSCDVFTISVGTWDHCMRLQDIFMRDATRLITRIRLDPMHYAFIGDDFLRLILLRYIFCECTLRLHRAFRSRNNLPRVLPPIPEDIFEHRDLVSLVLEIADCVGVRSHFYESSKPEYE